MSVLRSLEAIEPGQPTICEPIFDHVDGNTFLRIYLSQNMNFRHKSDVTCFYADELEYFAFCDDFGPMNFASVVSFIGILEQEIMDCSSHALVFCARNGRRALTNATFLLGAYMVLRMKMPPIKVSKRFEGIDENCFEGYRDATFSPPDFRLNLIDCWAGLDQAMERNWLAYPTRQAPKLWGRIHIDEYIHYDNPLNGDLHEVIPGALIAFQGPEDLCTAGHHLDSSRGHRKFAPAYYLDIFRELGVSAVVRLNEPRYDARAFTDAGIAHHDLPFDDCAAPPRSVVAAFLRIVDAAPGPVAVHCKAGLGRTGTLAALLLMRTHGLSARAAVGWLRIVRPGSVIGEQQHYLCEVERLLQELRPRDPNPDPASPRPGRDSAPIRAGVAGVTARVQPGPRSPTPPPSCRRPAPPAPPPGGAASRRPPPPPALAAQAAGMARRGAARAAAAAARPEWRPAGVA
jgi:protein-tyrosine phosphatase